MADTKENAEPTVESLQKTLNDASARLRHTQADLEAERAESVRLRGALDKVTADTSGESWKAASEAERARAAELNAKLTEAAKKLADYEAQVSGFDTRLKIETEKVKSEVENVYRKREETAQKKTVVEKTLRDAGAHEDMVDVLASLVDVEKLTVKDGKIEGFDVEAVKKSRPSAFGAANSQQTGGPKRPPDVSGAPSRDGLPVPPPEKTASIKERIEYNERLAREKMLKRSV